MDSRDGTCGSRVWTKNKPGEPGYYWLKSVVQNDYIKEIVSVAIDNSGVWIAPFYYNTSDDGLIPISELIDPSWHGPIMPPD